MKNAIKNIVALTRLDKPAGIFLLLFPCLWAVAFASQDFLSQWRVVLLFAFGAIIMRSAGCIINDIWDREIDAKVARTQNRPLASGAISLKAAIILFCLLSLAGLFILLQLKILTILVGLCSFVFVILYPLAKRFMKVPQIMLGLTFNFGAIMAYAEINDKITIESILLYIACFFWTLGYDTIYAHQDKLDDVKVGINSSALTFGKHTKLFVSVFYTIMALCLFQLGFMTFQGLEYFILILAAISLLYFQLYKVDLNNPRQCFNVFKASQYIGLLILLAIFV